MINNTVNLLIYEKYREICEGITKQDCLVDIVDFLLNNEPIDFKKYRNVLKPFIKSYSKLYRAWAHTKYIEDLKPDKNKTLSTSKTKKGIINFIDNQVEIGADVSFEILITLHNGKGIDIFKVLNELFDVDNDYSYRFENDYDTALQLAKDTEEVLLFTFDKPSKNNVYGIYDFREEKFTKS